MRMFARLLSISLLIFTWSCTEDYGSEAAVPKKDSTAAAAKDTSNKNNVLEYPDRAGITGIFNVPSMLCISIIDSAAMKDVSAKLTRDYALLEEDVNSTGAEIDGPPGQISYNNDPSNFRFESLLLIKKIPAKQPAHGKIVVLEAGPMVIYNYYGPYQKLFTAYDEISSFCKKNKLKPAGPMREFYITDPSVEKDKSKWLTRIMVPVTEKNNKP
jgi:effector-binding domain-containing protein